MLDKFTCYIQIAFFFSSNLFKIKPNVFAFVVCGIYKSFILKHQQEVKVIERVNNSFYIYIYKYIYTQLQKAFCCLIKRFVMELCACGLFILL